ncbi:MAG: hypothetical protein KAJ33_00930 [Thermoplasmata archaeon]|nr:hypothetical protein [Thermoplasmata archaeon]
MKMNKKLTIAAILAISFVMLVPGIIPAEQGPENLDYIQGTRAGEIGWQYDTFTQNLNVNVTPETITTMDQIMVTITSEISAVWIKQASLYGVVYPDDGLQFPISFPFFKLDTEEMSFRCVLEPFSQFSGYEIEFYIVAYDYFNSAMDSRSSNLYFTYSATGSGWRNNTFEENIELTYWPLKANATEEVEVTIKSINFITIVDANLYIVYETAEGIIEEGGWNFSKTNSNSTEMRVVIPGYAAGTNITFWVTAWDIYEGGGTITSKEYKYSVIGIVEYTDFPFEYSDSKGNKDVWVPDDVITLSMAGMCALGIPLFIYLYAASVRRAKRADDLIMKKNAVVETATEEPMNDGELPEAIIESDSTGGETNE